MEVFSMGNGVQSPRAHGRSARAEGGKAAAGDRAVDDLARRVRRGDRTAAAELCSACAPDLQRYFTSALRRSDDDPEDATQQVLLQVLEALPRYRQEGIPFRAWLFRIAHNVAVDRMRASSRRARATDPRDLDRASEAGRLHGGGEAGDRDERGALAALIAPLPRLYRQVLTLLYVHDMTPAQAGRVLGRSPEAVRQAHKRARDALRGTLLTSRESA
jgi:RNA polymerase sigma-70 factor (ECF subfamily)